MDFRISSVGSSDFITSSYGSAGFLTSSSFYFAGDFYLTKASSFWASLVFLSILESERMSFGSASGSISFEHPKSPTFAIESF